MAKKFFWLKLKEDFFDEDTIQWLEEQKNGKEYCLFYLKMCLKSLKTNGILIRQVGQVTIPYEIAGLAKMTNTNIDTVVVAMKLFEQIKLVVPLENGEIFLTKIGEMVGSETDKAHLMRKKRELEKSNGNNVTKVLPNCYTEIEIEQEIETTADAHTRNTLTKYCQYDLPTDLSELCTKCEKIGLTLEVVINLIKKYGKEVVLSQMKNLGKNTTNIKSKDGWLCSALENNYKYANIARRGCKLCHGTGKISMRVDDTAELVLVKCECSGS